MQCPKCKNKINIFNNVCPSCHYFLKRAVLKEIILIVKKYQQKKDYRGVYEILQRALEITAGTKYEKRVREQLEIAKQHLLDINEKINDLKARAKKNLEQSNYKKAIDCYRQILSYPLKHSEQIIIENELLKIKAHIYNIEMQDLTDPKGRKLFAIQE